LLIALVVVVVLFLAWLVILPVAILLLDIAFLMLIAVAGIATRMLFKRPWIIEATTSGEHHRCAIVGWRASQRAVDQIARALERGHSIESMTPRMTRRVGS
jgi:hypothetical protein